MSSIRTHNTLRIVMVLLMTMKSMNITTLATNVSLKTLVGHVVVDVVKVLTTQQLLVKLN